MLRATAFRGALLLVSVPAAARAQVAPSTGQASTAAPFTAGWQDGFVLQSADGDYRLVLGMVAQADGRFSLDDPKPIINTFTVRKLRPTFSGRVAKYFDFKVMPDFGNGTAVVQDAYVDLRFSPAFRVRSGKDKTPVGYELLQGDAFLWFPERSLVSSLVPNRDIGIQVQGDLAGSRLGYAAGVFNGVPDGSSSTTELDANNAKDLAARIVVQPFRSQTWPARLRGVGFHLGGSAGQQTGPLPSFRTTVGQTYFSYATHSAASGTRTRISPAAFYYYRSVGLFGEYARTSQTVSRSGAATRVDNHAYELTASFMVTGEPVSYGAIRPAENFDPSRGRWGALQLLVRFAALTVDRGAFQAGLAAPNASRRAESVIVAANWFPNGFIKYYATFERTAFAGGSGAPRPAEHVIVFRTQLGF